MHGERVRVLVGGDVQPFAQRVERLEGLAGCSVTTSG